MNAPRAMDTIRKSLAVFLAAPVDGAPGQGVVIAGSLGALAAVLGVELLIPPLASLGAFAFVPVVIAGWWLPARVASAVIGLALVVRFIGILGGVHPITAVAETVMLVTIGVGTVLAADRFRLWRQAQVRLHAQACELAAAAERERIAQELTRSVIRTAFAVTLDLQAALGLADQEAVRQRIESASKQLDGQITSVRGVVFNSRPAEPDGIAGHTLSGLHQVSLREGARPVTEAAAVPMAERYGAQPRFDREPRQR